MIAAPKSLDFAGIVVVLTDYFDGLYLSDADKLTQVFAPQAIYATVAEGTLKHYDMATYLPIVRARPSPASRQEQRRDRIVSIEFAGPVTAVARVECAIGPLFFSDFLTLVHLDGRWQIIAKAFHFDTLPNLIGRN